jgi:hypothetical protein
MEASSKRLCWGATEFADAGFNTRTRSWESAHSYPGALSHSARGILRKSRTSVPDFDAPNRKASEFEDKGRSRSATHQISHKLGKLGPRRSAEFKEPFGLDTVNLRMDEWSSFDSDQEASQSHHRNGAYAFGNHSCIMSNDIAATPLAQTANSKVVSSQRTRRTHVASAVSAKSVEISAPNKHASSIITSPAAPSRQDGRARDGSKTIAMYNHLLRRVSGDARHGPLPSSTPPATTVSASLVFAMPPAGHAVAVPGSPLPGKPVVPDPERGGGLQLQPRPVNQAARPAQNQRRGCFDGLFGPARGA